MKPDSANSDGVPLGEESAPQISQEILNKQIFTTGEAAEICKVSQQTIIRCFDSGRLDGFRVPGSKFRRIPRPALIKFMKDNHLSMACFEAAAQPLVLFGEGLELDALPIAQSQRPTHRPTCEFDLGLTLARMPNSMVVIRYTGDEDMRLLVSKITARPHRVLLLAEDVIPRDGVVDASPGQDHLSWGSFPISLEQILQVTA